MLPRHPPPIARHHLAAATVALSVLLTGALAIGGAGRFMERKSLDAMLPLFAPAAENPEDSTKRTYLEHLKNQGIAIQQRIFERSDLLPLYGSSELMKDVPDKPNIFFRHFPTGFAVAPVGKAGSTSLIMLHKLGSLGDVVSGRRVAFSFSPSWFFRDSMADRPYDGNFSRQQAFSTLLNPRLSFGVKRDLARRMLLRPAAAQHDTLLWFLTHRLARGEAIDRAIYRAVWPLAQMQKLLYATQDHFETLLTLAKNFHRLPAAPAREPAPPDWARLIAKATQATAEAPPHEAQPAKRRPDAEEYFRAAMDRSPEWQDFELLLRGLREMGIRPLVFCMPHNGAYFKDIGVSQDSLDRFAARLHAVAERHGARVEAFEDHLDDADFVIERTDHLTVKGWMHYNRLLDEFYHAEAGGPEHVLAKGRHKRAHRRAG